MDDNIKDQWTNPIVEQRADPFVYLHSDGFYYFIGTVPEFDRIELRRAKTLGELGSVQAKDVWMQHETGEMRYHIWAPEIHFIDNKWYIYFAAAHSDEEWRIRMYVLENESANPLEGSWIEKGRIKTLWESFSLDATTFEADGKRYLVWAQSDPKLGGNSSIFIDEMINPWTLAGKQSMLTHPELPWETIGFKVNEGPAVLQVGGYLFLAYSASATDSNYCMGLLTARAGSDLLAPSSWSKSDSPVFRSSEKNGLYGPGHNCFTWSQDKSKIYMVYHARQYKEIIGEPLHDPNRNARVQEIWAEGDRLILGEPV